MTMSTEKTRKLLNGTKSALRENYVMGTSIAEKRTSGDAQEAVATYINGNISDFKIYLKDCSKLDICDVIEILRGQYGYKIHAIIDILRRLLPQE